MSTRNIHSQSDDQAPSQEATPDTERTADISDAAPTDEGSPAALVVRRSAPDVIMFKPVLRRWRRRRGLQLEPLDPVVADIETVEIKDRDR